MRKKFLHYFFTIIFLNIGFNLFSQEITVNKEVAGRLLDSLKQRGVTVHDDREQKKIEFTRDQAIQFLKEKTDERHWDNPGDPLRHALDRLVFEASHERFDSIDRFLRKYPYDSLIIPLNKYFRWDSLTVNLPSGESLNLLTDTLSVITLPRVDSLLIAVIDSSKTFFPPVTGNIQTDIPDSRDTTVLIAVDTLNDARSDFPDFPFDSSDYYRQTDSVRIAVNSLLDYIEARDSSVISFTGIGNSTIPVWLNSQATGSMKRYWLKNEFSDSVTVWIGNEGRNTFGLYLEQGINFRKPMRQENYSAARVNVEKVDQSRLEKSKIVLKKSYWDYKSESSVVFSQSSLSNWVKGGENSISTALDITAFADYKRPELKLSSSNFIRLKLGFLSSGGQSVRKNLDLLETNSKINHKAFGKFDFSAIMLFKTQVAVGKQYSKVNDPVTSQDVEVSTIVSKFMNPATLTLGFGLDYKPDKETSINFSPLSYKGTFVPAAGKITEDSVIVGKIDQTRYGVAIGKKSKNEPGASFMISRVSRPLKNLTLTNRLQLFTNYIHNPLNIDVDWEMIAVMNLNWFTDLRLNTHLIFDDDTKTTVYEGGVPVKLEDGTEKKTARIQFKEMFGVSLVFRF